MNNNYFYIKMASLFVLIILIFLSVTTSCNAQVGIVLDDDYTFTKPLQADIINVTRSVSADSFVGSYMILDTYLFSPYMDVTDVTIDDATFVNPVTFSTLNITNASIVNGDFDDVVINNDIRIDGNLGADRINMVSGRITTNLLTVNTMATIDEAAVTTFSFGSQAGVSIDSLLSTPQTIIAGTAAIEDVTVSTLVADDSIGVATSSPRSIFAVNGTGYMDDLIFVDPNGTTETIRGMKAHQLDAFNELATTRFSTSCATSGGARSVTATQDDGENLDWVLNRRRYEHNDNTMTVETLEGTDANPIKSYSYVTAIAGEAVMVATSNNPHDFGVKHVDIAYEIIGANGNVYSTRNTQAETYEKIEKIMDRFADEGPLYSSGMTITATATQFSITSGKALMSVNSVITPALRLDTDNDNQFTIEDDSTYKTYSDLQIDEYHDGVAFGNKYMIARIGIVINNPEGTSARFYIIPSNGSATYTNASAAWGDASEMLVTVPREHLIAECFIPLANIVIRNNGGTYTLEQHPETTLYYHDVRQERGGGSGGGGGSIAQNLWATIDSDSGSTTADISTDTLTIAGGSGISTAVVADTLTITNTAGGGSVDDPLTLGRLNAEVVNVTGNISANVLLATTTITGATADLSSIIMNEVQATVDAALPDGWNTALPGTYTYMESKNGGDVGLFLRHDSAAAGIDVWFDHNAAIAYIDTLFNSGGADVKFRSKTGATPVINMDVGGDGNVWILNDCSALTFTDRTPEFIGSDPIGDMKKVKAKLSNPNQIDHKTLGAAYQVKRNKDNKIISEGRNMSMTLSQHRKAIIQLENEYKAAIAALEARVKALEVQ